jgi:hypothetical protein
MEPVQIEEIKASLFSACRYLKQTHGRNESETARRILTVASKCVGTDTPVDMGSYYIRIAFERDRIGEHG